MAATSSNNSLQQQYSLSVVSYNMHGFNQGFSTVRDLAASTAPDVFLLQEHWLTPTNLTKFELFNDYFAFGSSAMHTACESIVRGRPFGGLMILVKNCLRNNTQTIYSAERCVILKIFDYVIINVYLPCVGTPDRLLILDDVFSDISNHIDSFSDCTFLLGGDFNCDLDKVDAAALLINNFLTGNRLIARCDVSVGCKGYYTYINETSNRRSCIDYFVISDASKIVSFNIFDEGSNLSDHMPIIVNVICDNVVKPIGKDRNSSSSEAAQTFLRWDHADLVAYYQLTGVHLQALLQELNNHDTGPVDAIYNDDFKSVINSIYNRTVDSLRNCANLTVPHRTKAFYKFWWNEELDCLKQQSIDDHKLWKAVGKPRQGQIFDKCRTSKLLYKQRIREYQRHETNSYSNELHEALLAKNGPRFWQCWRSKFNCNKTRVGQVDGLVNDTDIVHSFENYFAAASSKLTVTGSQNLKQVYDCKRLNYFGTPHLAEFDFDVELVEKVVHNMKRGKAAGLDCFTVEHILHSHPAIYLLLNKIFNLLIQYQFVPDEFGRSYTVPIPKGNTTSKSLSVDDFRGISISPVISKIFEGCVLDRYGHFLVTSDNQFGFKKKLGCSHAIYSVRCAVNHYTERGSTVNLCALDLSKAFDKMNHNGLFIKLMDRMIPNNLLKLLEFWYAACITCVRWGNIYSCFFKLECGVRQGGVLSPHMFACYIDDIVKSLQRSGLGCHIRHFPVCIFLYADDIILLSPSVGALQEMVFTCERELAWLDMALNAKKSTCIRFGPRYDSACAPLVTVNGHQLDWVKTCRYLGVFFMASTKFKCSFDCAKKSYYRSFNSVFGKIGRSASEELTVKLMQTKCLPVILYGLDACPVNSADKHSLDFVLTRSLMKIFMTGSNLVICEIRRSFNIKLFSESVLDRKMRFLSRFIESSNSICHLLSSVASAELVELSNAI